MFETFLSYARGHAVRRMDNVGVVVENLAAAHVAGVRRRAHMNAGFNGVCRRIAGWKSLLTCLVEVLIAGTACSHIASLL
jgi:hypothetical protein